MIGGSCLIFFLIPSIHMTSSWKCRFNINRTGQSALWIFIIIFIAFSHSLSSNCKSIIATTNHKLITIDILLKIPVDNLFDRVFLLIFEDTLSPLIALLTSFGHLTYISVSFKPRMVYGQRSLYFLFVGIVKTEGSFLHFHE